MPKTLTRKIEQIATDNDRLFALCSDGTIWAMDTVDPISTMYHWEQLPEIPQPEAANHEN